MISLIAPNFLSRYPLEQAVRKFGKTHSSKARILDIGCGKKPYAKYFSGTYTGVDHSSNTKADIVCDGANIPLASKTFDAIVCNQTLEHTENLKGTVNEIKRLLKPGGYAIISAPLIMKVHSEPLPSEQAPYHCFDPQKIPYWNTDFWRFTKSGLISLFRDFKVVSLNETSGYAGTIFQLINYFFASLSIPYIFAPLYLVTNSIALLTDETVKIICLKTNLPLLHKFYYLIYASAPLNYILIVRAPSDNATIERP